MTRSANSYIRGWEASMDEEYALAFADSALNYP